jgi:glycosyltransferase involved in cell wall biosynthesis
LPNTLYITFDGLCDPLGRSQILPYLNGIAAKGYSIHIISCEKKERLAKGKQEIKDLLSKNNISWDHVLYDEEGGFFSRFTYLRKLASLAAKLNAKKKFQLVHCRSYLPALIGLEMKARKNVPFVFDMRGLWADERMDGDIWKKKNFLHRIAFNYFKKKEKEFLKSADAVVSLTRAGLDHLSELFPEYQLAKKTRIIPCCTDLSMFDPASVSKPKENFFEPSDHVLIYSGSIGTWYLTREMIDCVLEWRKKIPDLKLLVLTRDIPALQNILSTYTAEQNSIVKYTSASYQEIPTYLSLAKAAIFFIKPAPSKIASSPTKMAECWAMNLPIISNAGIGDSDHYFKQHAGGVLLHSFTTAEQQRACTEYLQLLEKNIDYRKIAAEHFNVKNAIDTYTSIYKDLIK